jgi:hypothetical protein
MTGLNANTAASNDAGNCLMAWLYCAIVTVAFAVFSVACNIVLASFAADRNRTNRLYAPTAQQIQVAKNPTQSIVLSISESAILKITLSEQ